MKIIKSLLVILLFNGCCPDSVETDRYFLTEDQIGLLPYMENGSSKMVYSNGFEFNLNTVERKTELNKTEIEHCGDNYRTYEQLTATINSEIPELNIQIEVTPKDYSPFLNLTINAYYRFAFGFLAEPDFDTLDINGKNFNNVYLMARDGLEDDVIEPKEVLYNKEFGIIQIMMTNNEKITLKQ